jgi:hypothetical protein
MYQGNTWAVYLPSCRLGVTGTYHLSWQHRIIRYLVGVAYIVYDLSLEMARSITFSTLHSKVRIPSFLETSSRH